MNDSQLTEIRNYLLDKKLPIDILMEVQDHFISQINDLQRDENLTFDEAFQKTKNSWQDELKPYWDGGWDLFDKNNMVRKFERMMLWTTLKKSILYGFYALILMVFLAIILPIGIFKYVSLVLLCGVTIYPLYNYITNFKTFALARKYQDTVLTIYQSFTFINVIFIFQLYKIFLNFDKYAVKFQQLIAQPELFDGAVFLLIYLYAFSISFFALISQKEYLKRMEKVKPFLKYLKTSN